MADHSPRRTTPPALWAFRALWLVLPLVLGPAVADAFSSASRPVQITSAAISYLGWGTGLASSLVPRSATLTACRVITPGAGALAIWSVLAGDEASWALGGLVIALLALVALALPVTTDAFVDGSSYGSERRLALTTPAAVVLGPAPIAVAVVGAAAVAGPMLLAARQWVAGGAALVLGIPAAYVVLRRLHVLARRWLVFVPAGLVVHDPLNLAEPVLLQRGVIESVGPASEGTTALDLTSGALGLVLEIGLREPVSLGLRRGRATVETAGVTAVLVAPHRPAAALELAAEQRLPVG